MAQDYTQFVNVGEQYREDAETFLILTHETNQMSGALHKTLQEVNISIEEAAATIMDSSNRAQRIAQWTEYVNLSLEESNEAARKLSEVADKLNRIVVQFNVGA